MIKNILIALIASALFTQQSFANSKIEVEMHSAQANINAVINIADNCIFTGWARGEKEVSFYATCNKIKKSITVKDDGLLNSFIVKKYPQEESIQLTVYRSLGVDWEKLNKALSDNAITAKLLPSSAIAKDTKNNDLCWNLKINTHISSGSNFALLHFANKFKKTRPIIDNILINNIISIKERDDLCRLIDILKHEN